MRVAHGGASAVVAFNNSDNSQRMTLPVGEKIGAHDGCEFEEPLANGQRLHVSGGQLHVELPPMGSGCSPRVNRGRETEGDATSNFATCTHTYDNYAVRPDDGPYNN